MTYKSLYKRISDTFSKKEKYTLSNVSTIDIELPEINFDYKLNFSLYMMDRLIYEIFTDLQNS